MTSRNGVASVLQTVPGRQSRCRRTIGSNRHRSSSLKLMASASVTSPTNVIARRRKLTQDAGVVTIHRDGTASKWLG